MNDGNKSIKSDSGNSMSDDISYAVIKTKMNLDVHDIYGNAFEPCLFVNHPFKVITENDDYVVLDVHDTALKFYKGDIDRIL